MFCLFSFFSEMFVHVSSFFTPFFSLFRCLLLHDFHSCFTDCLIEIDYVNLVFLFQGAKLIFQLKPECTLDLIVLKPLRVKLSCPLLSSFGLPQLYGYCYYVVISGHICTSSCPYILQCCMLPVHFLPPRVVFRTRKLHVYL